MGPVLRKRCLKRPKKLTRRRLRPEPVTETSAGAGQTAVSDSAASREKSPGEEGLGAVEASPQSSSPIGIADPAIQEVIEAIESDGGVLKRCLPDWHLRHKPKVGRFRKFLRAHPDLFTITDIPGDCFLVSRTGQPPPPAYDPRSWKRALRHAWRRYRQQTPEERHSLQDFLRQGAGTWRLARGRSIHRVVVSTCVTGRDSRESQVAAKSQYSSLLYESVTA
ncbi:unnamed protein product [Symbiodinium pilosum]|uniref:Uncharacterized protein n=1 Tax=Symbiodinium pilosum TaxID=2952 RepID=A0A812W3J8_SYMPI|nr:unnamed protein product [Symbiodinium pilosum]